MARTRVVLNSRGMGRLLRSTGVRANLDSRAQRVAARARSTAPVDTGDYREQIDVESVTTDRAVARIVARASHSLAVEAKTRNLGAALDAAGD